MPAETRKKVLDVSPELIAYAPEFDLETRRELAKAAFYGNNNALYNYCCALKGYEEDGKKYPACGLSLADCLEVVTYMDGYTLSFYCPPPKKISLMQDETLLLMGDEIYVGGIYQNIIGRGFEGKPEAHRKYLAQSNEMFRTEIKPEKVRLIEAKPEHYAAVYAIALAEGDDQARRDILERAKLDSEIELLIAIERIKFAGDDTFFNALKAYHCNSCQTLYARFELTDFQTRAVAPHLSLPCGYCPKCVQLCYSIK